MLKFVYKIFPLTVFASYPILLVYTFLWQKDLFLKSLTVPAGVFLGITLLRIIIKEERPYVRYGVAPVFAKNSKPDSMPSRHTASAFIHYNNNNLHKKQGFFRFLLDAPFPKMI